MKRMKDRKMGELGLHLVVELQKEKFTLRFSIHDRFHTGSFERTHF